MTDGDREPDDDALETARREALESIRQEGARVAIDTRLEIQEKTRQWVAASSAFLILALGLLAFFGYKETADFRRKLSELETQAEQSIADAHRTTREQVAALEKRTAELQDQVDRRAEEAAASIAAARDELDEARAAYSQRLEELDAAGVLLADSRAVLGQTRQLEATYREAQRDVQRQLEQIARLQNSFFNVFVMYHGPDSEVSGTLDPLLREIRDAGFVVEPENIMRLRVDRTEILYYDESRPPQVDTVLELVRESPLGERLAARGEPPRAAFKGRRNPRDLLIKVRLY